MYKIKTRALSNTQTREWDLNSASGKIWAVLAFIALGCAALWTLTYLGGVYTPQYSYYLFSAGGLLFAAISIGLLLADRVGDFSGVVYNGASFRGLLNRGQLQSYLDRARYFKRQGQLNDALLLLDCVLEMDPRNAEAMFVKAQIMWEGYQDYSIAQAYLKKAIPLLREGESLRYWCQNYLSRIRSEDSSQWQVQELRIPEWAVLCTRTRPRVAPVRVDSNWCSNMIRMSR